jgi:hypothetical protein
MVPGTEPRLRTMVTVPTRMALQRSPGVWMGQGRLCGNVQLHRGPITSAGARLVGSTAFPVVLCGCIYAGLE